MDTEITKRLIKSIKVHEGFSSTPYTDSTGHMTIYWGHNLDTPALSNSELTLRSDISIATHDLVEFLPMVLKIGDVRLSVLIEMVFNLGIEKFKEFKGVISAVERHDFDQAASAMLDSLWAKEVHTRARDMAKVMKDGHY